MLNHIAIMGRLTVDPELKTTPNGVYVTSFTIAVERPYRSGSGEAATDFISVVAWRTTAEHICRYFKKGKLIVLEGSLQARKYKDREGKNRTAYEVIANTVHFAGDREKSTAQSSSTINADEFIMVPENDDEFPF